MTDLIAYVSCAEDRRIDVLAVDPVGMTLRKQAEVAVPGPPAAHAPLKLSGERCRAYRGAAPPRRACHLPPPVRG